jgi:hypothetical protein
MNAVGGGTHGSTTLPLDFGSGGGGSFGGLVGGRGGGVIGLMTSSLRVDGKLSADGLCGSGLGTAGGKCCRKLMTCLLS